MIRLQRLSRVKDSGLKISQITNATKTFIFTCLDYCTMNSKVSKIELDKLGIQIRKTVNMISGHWSKDI
jgi:hypothetical protein